MKKFVLVVSIALITVLALANQPPSWTEQSWLEPSDVPFSYDPNKVDGYLVKAIEVETGSEYGIEQRLYHDLGLPMALTFTNIPTGAIIEGNWLRWIPNNKQVGVNYVYVSVTDQPTDPNMVSKTVRGTWVVLVHPFNPGPILQVDVEDLVSN